MKKRWHSIPTILLAVLLTVILTTGAVLAVTSEDFFTASVEVEVEEAIVLGEFSTWDNLKPYGSDLSAVWEWEQDAWHTGVLGDVAITLGESAPHITIAAVGSLYAGKGFVAGEWIVIPLNIRNGGSGLLNLSASVVTSGGLEVDYCWLENTGTFTEEHPDGNLNRDFKDDGNWASLSGWSEPIGAYGGESGSARLGAQVLFVRIKAPGNIAPSPEEAPYNLSITLYRN